MGNQSFFAEYLTVLAMTIDPDPTVEVEEEEIFIPDEEQEKYRTFGNGTSRKGSITSSSYEDSLMAAKRRLLNCDEIMETSLDQNVGVFWGGSGPDSRQKNAPKKMKKLRRIPT